MRNMVPTPLAAFRTDAASPRSPVTRSAPADISCRAASLSGLRVSALTRCPLDSSARATAPPCWPVAPVTRTLRLVLMWLLLVFFTGASWGCHIEPITAYNRKRLSHLRIQMLDLNDI